MAQLLNHRELLARLVSFDTTSRNSNLPIADFISDYLDRPGIRIERNQSIDGTKTNVVVTAGPNGSESGKGLVLSGHTDVVPAEEPDWHSDPFTLTEVNGTLVARGACDMKGFIALSMNAAARLESKRATYPLVLIFTYDEEVGTLGARHFADTWSERERLPKSAIIGEPTSLRVVRMHKGLTSIRVTVLGKSAHSGYPHLGKNAIEPIGRFIVGLTELRRSLEREEAPNSHYFSEVPFTALNIGQVIGGSAINVIPDRCAIGVGFRLLPGMTSAPLLDRVRAIAEDILGDVEYTIEIESESPPMLLNESAEINRFLSELVDQQETSSASYATDAGWFQTMGLECVIMGPGTIEVAHKPNESIPVDELEQGAALLERVVERFCVTAD